MSVFCLLFVPLFYFFRRSVTETNGSGGVWALLLGSLTAVIQFFLGYFVSPGGFGLTRWLFGFVDIVSVPVILPLVIYSILFLFRSFSGEPDFTNFTLLWLIPVAVLRAIAWSETSDSILLIAAPILWTSLAVGIPFFIFYKPYFQRFPLVHNFYFYFVYSAYAGSCRRCLLGFFLTAYMARFSAVICCKYSACFGFYAKMS